MGHVLPNLSDFPHTLSQCRKTFPLWANAERISPYTEPKKSRKTFPLYWANAERHSPDKGPMQNNIPLCWAHVRANAERISPYTEPKKAERLSPYTEPTQKDNPLIRGQCRIIFLHAEPMWNDQKLWISIWVSLVRNAKGFGQKYIKKRTNYQYMAMGHVPPNRSDFPHTLSQCRKTFSWWANTERLSPYTEPKKAERLSLYTEPMQNNIPLCWANVEQSNFEYLLENLW
jgi:hypothetical protein